MRRNGLFSFVHDEIDADKIFFDLVPMGFFKSKYVEAQGRGVHIRTSVHGEAGVMYVIVPCYKQKQAKKFALARDFVIFSFLVPFQIRMGNFQVPKSLFWLSAPAINFFLHSWALEVRVVLCAA